MAERIPIMMTPARKANFAGANFELKFLAVIFAVLGLAPFIISLGGLLLGSDSDLQKIFGAIITPCTYAIIYMQGAILCGRLTVTDQSLKRQLQLRLYIILFLLVMMALAYCGLSSLFNIQHFSTQLYQKIGFYRQVYNIYLPALLILTLLIRTIPMMARFYKLKNNKA